MQDQRALSGWRIFDIFSPDPAFLTALQNTGSGRLGPGHHHPARHAARAAARPAGDRAQRGSVDGDCAVFVMPTVGALVWKNLLMHPVSGLFAWIATSFGVTPIDWFTDAPLLAVILIVSWEWLPFATLILLTALQSQDGNKKEAAEMDGASALSTFIYLTLPHARAAGHGSQYGRNDISADGVCRDIRHDRRRPGLQTTNIAFPDLRAGTDRVDVERLCRGLVAVVIANIVAFFLVRIIGQDLEA